MKYMNQPWTLVLMNVAMGRKVDRVKKEKKKKERNQITFLILNNISNLEVDR